MIALVEILGVDALGDVDQFHHRLGVRLDLPQFFSDDQSGRDHLAHVRDQHRMVRHHRPAMLRDYGRRGHFLTCTDLAQSVDNVVGEFLHRVVHREIARGARAVVVDGQASSHVEIGDFEACLAGLGIDACGFLEGLLGSADVVDLRADVKVQHRELVGRTPFLDQVQGLHQGQSAHAELGKLPAGVLPLAAPACI